MIKNKWMWTGLLVCACIAAAVAVRPNAVKIQNNEANMASITSDAKTEVQNLDFSNTSLTKVSGKSNATFSSGRPITDADRAMMSPTHARVTEADKRAASEARALQPREPRNPSLDQGSDNCTAVPDLGSALGVAVATGTTVGATNDLDTTGWLGAVPACWQGTAFSLSTLGPDVYYKWTAPLTSTYTFSLCEGGATGNQYDTGITLWNFTCPTEPAYPADFICGNDDGGVCIGNFGSELTCLPLTAGQQILIVIDGYDVEAGAYSLDINDCLAGCNTPTCPPGASLEGEPTCGPNYVDATNGGCNSTPPVFQNLVCGDTLCAESGTYLVNDTVQSRDTDWFRLVLTDTTLVTCFAVAEFELASFTAVPGQVGFECDSLSIIGGPFVSAACDTQVISGCLPPGEYWFIYLPTVFTGIPCGSRYNVWWTCEPCVIDTTCANLSLDVTCPGPSSISGNTIGAGDDCRVSGAGQSDTLSEDQIIEINIPSDGLYTFSLCSGATVWDAFIHLTTGCCSGTVLESDDDDCGTVGGLSRITCRNLTAGTYYLIVEGWSQTDAGPWTLEVTCCAGCNVTCVDSETEPDCADGFVGSNDGCNLVVPAFEAINCGDTKCGSSGNYIINDSTNGRDIDWYSLTVTDTTRITWTWNAEFVARGWILNSNCNALATFATDTSLACSTKVISACVPAGTYLLLVAPTQFTGTACGSQYTATVNCVDCIIPPNIATCENDAIFGQNVDPNTAVWTFGTSDAATNFRRLENFTLTPGEVVGGISFWGLSLLTTSNTDCLEDPMSFEISYWSDSSGAGPDITNGFSCRDTVSLNRTATGQLYSGFPSYFWSYEYPEGQCCSLATGVPLWIAIKGVSVVAPNCRFLWASSGGSTGGFSVLYTSNVRSAATFNLALCLTPCAVPCFEVTNLTVYNAPGNAAAWLNFTAPQPAIYQIYSTLNPNADENPDNGGDANYTLEASVFFPAGPAQWTAAAGFSNFKKYVVVANCN